MSHHGRRTVTDQHSAKAQCRVDVSAILVIPDVGPFGFGDEEFLAGQIGKHPGTTRYVTHQVFHYAAAPSKKAKKRLPSPYIDGGADGAFYFQYGFISNQPPQQKHAKPGKKVSNISDFGNGTPSVGKNTNTLRVDVKTSRWHI